MARATKTGAAGAAASRKAQVAAGRGRPRTATGNTPGAKSQRGGQTAGRKAAGKTIARSASARSSEDGLQARVEKLERATLTLRAANRHLHRVEAEMTERLSELEERIDQLENKIAAARIEGDPDRPVDDVAGRVDHDPGGAVPPGVAVSEPEPPSEEDRRALEQLNEEFGPD